ncbi:MAG: hypothetical protein Kow00124_16360 [Anaerolineae bacterium]
MSSTLIEQVPGEPIYIAHINDSMGTAEHGKWLMQACSIVLNEQPGVVCLVLNFTDAALDFNGGVAMLAGAARGGLAALSADPRVQIVLAGRGTVPEMWLPAIEQRGIPGREIPVFSTLAAALDHARRSLPIGTPRAAGSPG